MHVSLPVLCIQTVKTRCPGNVSVQAINRLVVGHEVCAPSACAKAGTNRYEERMSSVLK